MLKRISHSITSWTVKVLLGLLLVGLGPLWTDSDLWAKPTTFLQARRIVENWLALEARPMGVDLGRQVREVAVYRDPAGDPLYFIVYLNPQGFVVVPADDLVEPIIGFAPRGVYDPSDTNPLGALVSRDVAGRVVTLRQQEQEDRATGRPGKHAGLMVQAQRKWRWLESPETSESPLEYGVFSVSDVRVAPLVASRWSQTNEGGAACYNYYTPPNSAGSSSNYPCGCVATAMAQLMRYWTWPTAGVGTASFSIKVDGSSTTRSLRGGDGFGGPYDWGNMVLDPSASTTTVQRQAIGALTHDAGVSVNMNYWPGGSGADTLHAADAFRNVFGYANAKKGYNSASNLPTAQRNAMVNPNLDARFPVLFGITGSPGGHAIVCDGYGYNGSTLYHHLNLGWAGTDDAWYNLPTIDTHLGTFTSVYKCVYNVYPTGTGEIISGRVTTTGGTPLAGVTITASRSGGGTYSAGTDAKGIYALARIPSGSTYTITPSKSGYFFSPQTVGTGTSVDGSTTTGNLWGINFAAAPTSLNEALDTTSFTFTTGGSAAWFGQTDTYIFDYDAAQSGAINHNQSSWLQTTISGPGALKFYWKVSSQAGFDFLKLYIDGNLMAQISGSVDWQLKSYDLTSGSHTVRWEYVKDGSVSWGSDCGWVDRVWFYRPLPQPGPAHRSLSHLFLLLFN